MDAASKRLHASGMSPRFPTPVGLTERGADTESADLRIGVGPRFECGGQLQLTVMTDKSRFTSVRVFVPRVVGVGGWDYVGIRARDD